MANLLTLNQVKDQLGIGPSGEDNDSYDDQITAALPLVTQWFEQYCDRGLALRTITDEEVFFNEYKRIYVWCFPIVSLTSVEVDGLSYGSSNYILNKAGGYFFTNATWRPRIEYSTRIVVSYVGGYAQDQVPADLAYAFASCCGNRAGVQSAASSSGGGGSAIKSIGLGGGALAVQFDTGVTIGGISGAYDVGNVPTEVQQYASVLNYYVRQRI